MIFSDIECSNTDTFIGTYKRLISTFSSLRAVKSVFAIEAPLFVELEITDTEPGFAGNTAQGATKPAVVETGATVYVPLFVNQGDVIKIDTRTGEYLSRV